jgi:hypothetical protein
MGDSPNIQFLVLAVASIDNPIAADVNPNKTMGRSD